MAEKYYNILLGARPQLVEMQNLLRRKLPDGTMFNDPASFHVTLVYIEDDKGLPDLKFDDLAADLPVFGLSGNFIEPYGDGPDQLAIGLEIAKSPQLQYLQAAIYYRAQAAGMKIGQFSYPNRFRPHITMATIPTEPVESRPLSTSVYLQSPVVVEVSSFHLTAEGSYEPVASWDLQTNIPIQEFMDNHTSNVEGSEQLNIREQVTSQDGKTAIELTVISEMKGGYPNIKLPADINVEAIQKQKRDFVTLPIGEVNAKSRNDRRYTRPAMEEMVAQINKNRPEGGWGHIPDEEMATSYGPPAIRWLVAMIDKDGIVWGKGLPLTSEAAQYFEDARLTNARVGTSLHAYVDMNEQDVMSMELIRLDLADPARVGVAMTAAPVQLSTEMADGMPPKQEAVPSETPNANQEVQESTTVSDSDVRVAELTAAKRTLETEMDALKKENKRLAGIEEDAKEIATILTFDANMDSVKAARLFKEQYDEMKAEATKLLEKAMVAQVGELVKVESVRPIVLEMVRDQKPFTEKALTRAIDDVLGRESVKKLLAAGVVQEMGQPQTPAPGDNRQSSGDPKKAAEKFLEPMPEAAK